MNWRLMILMLMILMLVLGLVWGMFTNKKETSSTDVRRIGQNINGKWEIFEFKSVILEGGYRYWILLENNVEIETILLKEIGRGKVRKEK